MTETSLERRYRKTLEHIRDFCMKRDFNVYCKRILQDVEDVLKLEEARKIAEEKKKFTPPRYDKVFVRGREWLDNLK